MLLGPDQRELRQPRLGFPAHGPPHLGQDPGAMLGLVPARRWLPQEQEDRHQEQPHDRIGTGLIPPEASTLCRPVPAKPGGAS
jgi:hypothetical protein